MWIFYINPVLDKPMIFAPELIKKKLNKYFENDQVLREAFTADAEVLNHCEKTDYLQGPTREEFKQIRAGLPRLCFHPQLMIVILKFSENI